MADTQESSTPVDWPARYRGWGLPARPTDTGVALVTDDWTTVASMPVGLAGTVDSPPGPVLACGDGDLRRWASFTWLDTPVDQRHAAILARADVRLSPVGTVVALPSEPGGSHLYWVREPGHRLAPTSRLVARTLRVLTTTRRGHASGLFVGATRCAGAACGDAPSSDSAPSRAPRNRAAS